MKKLHVLAVVMSIAVVAWHLYIWVFVYDAAQREGRMGAILVDELGVRGMREGLRDQAERMLLGRLARLWAERTLLVAALGLGLMQGALTRARLAYSGYRQNLWLSARLALLVALGTAAAICTLPGFVPYTPVILGLMACVAWAGFSAVAAFPVSM